MIYVGHWLGVHCVFFLHCCLWSINKDLFIISSKILSLKPKQHLIKDPLLSGTHGHNFLPCLHIINYAMSIILLFSLGWKLRSYGPASGVQSGQEHTKQEGGWRWWSVRIWCPNEHDRVHMLSDNTYEGLFRTFFCEKPVMLKFKIKKVKREIK